jgi:tricorn protease
MRHATCLVALGLIVSGSLARAADVRPHAGMLRYPDVSATHIVFSYANDLWIVPRAGGVAQPLASPPGQETFPRFSPDGKTIAFVGNYDGNRDLYTIPIDGGAAVRVTHHPAAETLCDFLPDGKLLFYSNALAGLPRQTQLFTVPATGGLPQMLPVPYGANGAINRDGNWLAYTPHTADARTWKRYRGGMATDVWLFNLRDLSAQRITDWEGTDSLPMWNGDVVYYLSDGGPEHRLNIWSYDTKSKQRKQVTTFHDDDVKWPSIGPGDHGQGEIVLQNGASLYLVDLGTGAAKPVEVFIPGDRPQIRPHSVDASRFISGWSLSPSAKRVAVEARGDVWTLPAEKGTPRNLTRTSGAAERDPSWSPDGRWIAYFSDETGEYELYLRQSDGKGEKRQLTSGSKTFRYNPVWSPDSKSIAFTDKAGNITLVSVDSGELHVIDTDPWAGSPGLHWSHDSRWLAWARGTDTNQNNAIFVYDTTARTKQQVTTGMFSDHSPVFDRKGDYLFFASSRNFSPLYGELDESFVYAGTEQLFVVPLRADQKSPWAVKSDEETWEKKGDAGGAKSEAKDDGLSGSWEGKATGPAPLPQGGITFTLELKLAADHGVTGTVRSPQGNGNITKGTFDPATKELKVELTDDDGNVWSIVAKLDGNALKGTATFQKTGAVCQFEGTRKSEAPAAKGKEESKPREHVDIELKGFEQRALPLPVKSGPVRQPRRERQRPADLRARSDPRRGRAGRHQAVRSRRREEGGEERRQRHRGLRDVGRRQEAAGPEGPLGDHPGRLGRRRGQERQHQRHDGDDRAA